MYSSWHVSQKQSDINSTVCKYWAYVLSNVPRKAEGSRPSSTLGARRIAAALYNDKKLCYPPPTNRARQSCSRRRVAYDVTLKSGQRSLKIIENGTAAYGSCKFLLVFYIKLYGLYDVTAFLCEMATFPRPFPLNAPVKWKVDFLKISVSRSVWEYYSRWATIRVECLMMGCVISIQMHNYFGWTEIQTDTPRHSICRAVHLRRAAKETKRCMSQMIVVTLHAISMLRLICGFDLSTR